MSLCHSTMIISDGGIKHSIGPFVGSWIPYYRGFKDAYFTIPIHPDHYKYLRIEWNSTLLEFVCLPFGISLAPRVFHQGVETFFRSIHNKGIRLVIYLVDMATISSSRELSSQEAAIVVQILEFLEFIINKEKSVLIPSQKIVFFGYIIDPVAMTFPSRGEAK